MSCDNKSARHNFPDLLLMILAAAVGLMAPAVAQQSGLVKSHLWHGP